MAGTVQLVLERVPATLAITSGLALQLSSHPPAFNRPHRNSWPTVPMMLSLRVHRAELRARPVLCDLAVKPGWLPRPAADSAARVLPIAPRHRGAAILARFTLGHAQVLGSPYRAASARG